MKPLAAKILALVLMSAALAGCTVYEQPGYYPPPAYVYGSPPPVVIYDHHPHWHGGGGGGWGPHWR